MSPTSRGGSFWDSEIDAAATTCVEVRDVEHPID